MIKLANKKDKIIGIFGLARTGEAVYIALTDNCKKIICYDDSEKNRDEFASKYGSHIIVPTENPIWKTADEIILSPGIPTFLPKPHRIVEIARENNIVISSDIELLYEAKREADFIAITGTNGKSTTSALIHHILKSDEKMWDLGGNIGNAVMNMEENAKGYVLELSSYQIEILREFSSNIAILLNITPDHLDRHGTLENYTNVKKSLVMNARRSIIGIDNPLTHRIFEELKSTHDIIPISTQNIVEGGVCARNGKIYDRLSGIQKEFLLPDNKSLQGEHNFENIAAAFAAARICNIEPELIIKQIASFVGLPHRMQFLGTKFNIDFYNDSKATNAEAASKSIAALQNIYLLLGGVAKKGGLETLLHLHNNIAKAYLFGEAKDLFAKQLENITDYQICDNLDEAFNAALSDAKLSATNANILLAPACASLDQFKDFEERGCRFIELYKII